jgi:hypothetical protein
MLWGAEIGFELVCPASMEVSDAGCEAQIAVGAKIKQAMDRLYGRWRYTASESTANR